MRVIGALGAALYAIMLVASPLACSQAVNRPERLPDFVGLVKSVGPAVVNISTTRTIRAEESGFGIPDLAPDDPVAELLRRFFSLTPSPREFQSRSLGSGFLLSADGFVLTNAHVVANMDEITVKLIDRREFRARMVGLDARTDIALVKIDGTGLPHVRLGKATALEVGEWVAAIGAPFGFENSVTAGIVSAKGRLFPNESYVPFIQTDVAVNPGNSGGPLFNLRGEVVGVNSMIYSQTGGFMGLSFAIPIGLAVEIAEQLKAHGRVIRGRLGIVAQPVTPDLARSFGLEKAEGALVTAVEQGGPADNAGIHPGDVIVSFAGKPVEAPHDLTQFIAATRPGTSISITIIRRGAEYEIAAIVGELAPDAPMRRPAQRPPNQLGLVVTDLTPEERALMNTEFGVVVRDVAGPALKAGLRRGDVIIALNDLPIADSLAFHRMVEDVRGRMVALLVRRGASVLYVPVIVG
jgi:serine protease Do